MHEAFEASVTQLGAETIVSLRGELDVAEAPALRATLLGLIAAGHDRLVIDLQDLDLVDSTGLSALIAARRIAAASGGGVVLADPRPHVRRVLDVMHLEELFPIVDGTAAPRPTLT